MIKWQGPKGYIVQSTQLIYSWCSCVAFIMSNEQALLSYWACVSQVPYIHTAI